MCLCGIRGGAVTNIARAVGFAYIHKGDKRKGLCTNEIVKQPLNSASWEHIS